MSNACYPSYTMKTKVERATRRLKKEEENKLDQQISGENTSEICM